MQDDEAAAPAELETSSSSRPSLGEVLRTTREFRRISVEHASELLRIEPQFLIALEQERFASIGPPVFVKGYLKHYCELLGLDPAPLLDELRERLGGDEPAVKARRSAEYEHRRPQLGVLVGGGIAAAAAAVVLWQLVQFAFDRWTSAPAEPGGGSISAAVESDPRALGEPGASSRDAASRSVPGASSASRAPAGSSSPGLSPAGSSSAGSSSAGSAGSSPAALPSAATSPPSSVSTPTLPSSAGSASPGAAFPAAASSSESPAGASADAASREPAGDAVSAMTVERIELPPAGAPAVSGAAVQASDSAQLSAAAPQPDPAERSAGATPLPAAQNDASTPSAREGRLSAAGAAPLEIQLLFEEDSWTEVTSVSGERLLYGLYRAGTAERVGAEGTVNVLLGNADGVDVRVNGESFAYPAGSRRGATARFRLSPPEE